MGDKCNFNSFSEYGSFVSISAQIGLPDDVTVGFIVSEFLNLPFKSIDAFHSHLEDLGSVRQLDNQVRNEIL